MNSTSTGKKLECENACVNSKCLNKFKILLKVLLGILTRDVFASYLSQGRWDGEYPVELEQLNSVSSNCLICWILKKTHFAHWDNQQP